jgi:hypothetical protein
VTITFVPDEWIELKGRVPKNDKPDVSISITFWNLKTNRIAEKGPRTMLFFRREAADWIEHNGSRFTIKLNKNLDRIAIVPNPKGLFVGSVNKGAGRIPLGVVLQLPNEQLTPRECEYSFSGNEMMLIDLPSDFASARGEPAPSVAKKTVPAAPKLAASAPYHQRTIERASRVVSHNFGDPPPGRSALDQKQK